MYAWEGRPFEDIARLCARRDPRRYPFGMTTAAPRADTPVVLQWFKDASELAAHLGRMEPQRWGLRGAELAEYKLLIEQAVIPIPALGLSEPLRIAHNRLSLPRFGVVWWGEFSALRAGRDGWAAQVVEDFGHAVDDDDAFIGFLRAHYLPA